MQSRSSFGGGGRWLRCGRATEMCIALAREVAHQLDAAAAHVHYLESVQVLLLFRRAVRAAGASRTFRLSAASSWPSRGRRARSFTGREQSALGCGGGERSRRLYWPIQMQGAAALRELSRAGRSESGGRQQVVEELLEPRG